MKPGIHPTWYPDAVVTCACGNTWTTGSTKKVIHTDVCNKCHPFFTGEQRIVDTAGQVERFMKRISAKAQIAATQPAPEDKKAKQEKRRERKGTTVSLTPAVQAPAELPLAVVVEEPAVAEAPGMPLVQAPVAQAEESKPPVKVEPPAPVAVELPAFGVEVEEPARFAQVEPVKPDDLEMVEGIGPKIASVLQDAGIKTFKQLAATATEKLQDILQSANLAMANPSTWAAQAGLAAEGKPGELKKLQAELVGGRRVAKTPAVKKVAKASVAKKPAAKKVAVKKPAAKAAKPKTAAMKPAAAKRASTAKKSEK